MMAKLPLLIRLRICVFALCTVSFSFSASGEEPPPLHASEWLQAPSGFDSRWGGMRGHVVVLEFWATWCPPCVDSIPHLNHLASEFRDKGVVFLAMTDDDPERLTSFLAKHPLNAFIGIDKDRKNWQSFGVLSIPHTVLIGKDGQTIGVTTPENITAAVLREALEGVKPVLPLKQGIDSDLSWDERSISWQDGVVPAIYAIIKPIKTATSGIWPRPAHFTADGVPLQALVQAAYETDSLHVDWRSRQDGQTYRVAFRVPDDRKERLLPYMRQTLANLFGIQARWENRESEVYVVRRLGRRAGPSVSQSDKELVQMMRGKLTLRRQSTGKLSQLLSNVLGRVVVDETGLSGSYDFDIPYQHGDVSLTTTALREIGIEAVSAMRTIPILVVVSE